MPVKDHQKCRRPCELVLSLVWGTIRDVFRLGTAESLQNHLSSYWGPDIFTFKVSFPPLWEVWSSGCLWRTVKVPRTPGPLGESYSKRKIVLLASLHGCFPHRRASTWPTPMPSCLASVPRSHPDCYSGSRFRSAHPGLAAACTLFYIPLTGDCRVFPCSLQHAFVSVTLTRCRERI